VLGYGYAWPAGLKVRRESTAIAGWPDHDASVALPPPKGAATRGVLIATRTDPPRLADGAVELCDEPSVSGRTPCRRYGGKRCQPTPSFRSAEPDDLCLPPRERPSC
jgi:hypothetical protein